MPKPQEHADIFIIIKKLFLVGLRGLQSMSNRFQTPYKTRYYEKIVDRMLEDIHIRHAEHAKKVLN